jgi:four helix bundle protein
MRDFRKMNIWMQGIEIAVKVYELCKQLPREEIYGLRAQITKASVSIPANIAEGCSRKSEKDFIRFLEISIGSAFELETHLIVAEKLQFVDSKSVAVLVADLNSEQRQINSLIKKIRAD